MNQARLWWLRALGGWLLCVVASAQAMEPVEMLAERERLAVLARTRGAALDAQEQACQRRFAVTDCVLAVQRQRRQWQEEHDRREAALQDLERAQRAAQARQAVAQRSAEHAARAASATVAPRQPREPARPVAGVGPPRQVRDPAVATDAAQAQANQAAFARRQAELDERRRSRDQRLREHTPTAAPLPVPAKP